MKACLIAVLLVFNVFLSAAQDLALFEKQYFVQGEDTLRCRILSPRNFSPNKKYPVMVFLHGSGERGTDNEAQLKWGGSLFVDSLNRVKFPAIVVFPQCPPDSSWARCRRSPEADTSLRFKCYVNEAPSRPLQLLMNFIDTLSKSPTVDTKRMYVGGLSMGGFGTFELLWRKPGTFAGALAICGGGDIGIVNTYARQFPVWVFHGDRDDVVPPNNSRMMVAALRGAGAQVKYTEYAGVSHDSWNNAFREPGLLPWLFALRKK